MCVSRCVLSLRAPYNTLGHIDIPPVWAAGQARGAPLKLFSEAAKDLLRLRV